jgi:hypothetical protein
MDSHQIQDIRLMYEAVYNNELREMAEEYNNEVYEDQEDGQSETGEKIKNEFGLSEEVDIFDCVLEYLLSEGYAETSESALNLMANMSQDDMNYTVAEATKLFYKLQAKGKRGSSTARAQMRSDADLGTQKMEPVRKQRQRKPERESDEEHPSLSARERNPSLR